MTAKDYVNPFRPGAGHMPPYLAGRQHETDEFAQLLQQDVILKNLILTGLRGVGKTVLLETFKPLALSQDWLWVGTDMTEAATLTDDRIATRLLTDLSVVTSGVELTSEKFAAIGFQQQAGTASQPLDYDYLVKLYQSFAGLQSDKLKGTLEYVWQCLKQLGKKGIVFAYDEAQNLSDHAQRDEYPLSLLLDVFQSIQRKDIPFMLALSGLPTLFPKLVQARTSSERMFHVVVLERLSEKDSRTAIEKPIIDSGSALRFTPNELRTIIQLSGGYPYFLQFICREAYDVAILKYQSREKARSKSGRAKSGATIKIAFESIILKLDTDFFAGRWSKTTTRQRELLWVIAHLENCAGEFTGSEIAEHAKRLLEDAISPSQINQMLTKLGEAGLIYKHRHGKYSFAVPLLSQFIKRQGKPD